MPVNVGGTWKTGILASGAYESIATITCAGSESSISFTSIPSTYKHLQIRFISKESPASGTANSYSGMMRINSDTGTNYATHRLYGDGSSVYADGASSAVGAYWTYMTTYGTGIANIYAGGIIDLHDYSSTTKNKTIRAFCGADANTGSSVGKVILSSGLWMNTAAVTTLTFTPANSSFMGAGSVFSLYGIKGA
jgi:hypothetical protein